MDERHNVDLPIGGEGLAPWEAYQRFMQRAQAARAQLLRNTLYTCAERLRARICALAERLHISLCPLCC
jgi:hypothetical protein